MTTKIYLPNDYILTNLINSKGHLTHAILGKLHVPGMRRAINVAFDALKCNLIIREWYMLTEEQRETVTATLTEFFSDYIAALAMK